MYKMIDYNLKIELPKDILSQIEKNKFKDKCHIEESDYTILYTSRSDIIDYYKKLLKQKKVNYKIYLLDPEELLKDIYLREGAWTQIPNTKWSSGFYTRFLTWGSKKSYPPEQVECTTPINPRLKEDQLNKLLIDEEWIYSTKIPGSFVYGGKYLNLVHKLSKLYEQIMDINLLEEEFKFSNLIPISELIRTNYFSSANPNFHYHLKCTSTVESLKKLGLKVYLEQYLDPKELLKHTTGPNYIMNYCSCQGLWLAYQNKSFISTQKVKRFYDKSVPTYRDEKAKVKSLERLEIFERFEHVFLGCKEEVVSYTQQLKEKLKIFFTACNIPIVIMRGANWFCEDQAGTGYTYDFEYLGESKNLEVGNISYNARLWTKPYNIKYNHKDGYSGCSGIGIQRLVYLFLLMNGIESNSWPI